MSSEIWKKRDNNLLEPEENIINPFGDQRASSYPGNTYFSQVGVYKEERDAANFGAPMWVSPNIEIKIADLGNACWVVSLIYCSTTN